ncbi:unnamed protein product [Calypogeia fissa]
MWDGTVSGIEFQAESMAFLALWNSADATSRQHWQWKPWADSTAGGYLTLEDVPTSTTSSDSGGQQWAEESHCLSDSADSPALRSDYGGNSADAATLVVDPVFNNQHTSFTYHVIYGESYNVPTLFFRGFHSDGSALNMEEVRRILTADSLLLLEKIAVDFPNTRRASYFTSALVVIPPLWYEQSDGIDPLGLAQIPSRN